MYYSTVYVGMDVHKKIFSLCCYTNEKETAEYPQKVEAQSEWSDHSPPLKLPKYAVACGKKEALWRNFSLRKGEVKFASCAVRHNFTYEAYFPAKGDFTCPQGKLSFYIPRGGI